MVAGDSPALNKPQFYSTLRLISLAQVKMPADRRAVAHPMLQNGVFFSMMSACRGVVAHFKKLKHGHF